MHTNQTPCPVCAQPMKVLHFNAFWNARTGTSSIRLQYTCLEHEVFTELTLPRIRAGMLFGEEALPPEFPRDSQPGHLCEFCQRRMYLANQGTSSNSQTGQLYIRTNYVCPHCDHWIKQEVPRTLASRIIDEAYLPQ